MIKNELHAGNYLARIGVEEFVILLDDTGLFDAKQLAEKYRKVIGTIVFPMREGLFNITCSFGVVQLEENMKSFDDMLIAVDKKLYEAKHSGKNTVK